MAVTIKSSQEIELMRQAGKILAKVHEGLKKELNPECRHLILTGSGRK